MTYHTTTETQVTDVRDAHRPHTIGSDFAVPFLQAVAVGGFFGLPLGWLADGAEGAAFGAATVAGLVFGVLIWRQQLTPPGRRQRRIQRDQVIPIAQPAHKLASRPAPGAILINAASHPAAQAQADQLDTERFIQFIRDCERYGTSSHYWEARMARPDFARMRAELIRAGYARWRGTDPKGGWHLTRPAEKIVAAIHRPTTPQAMHQ